MKINWIVPDVLAASGIPIGLDDLESLYEQGMRAIVSFTETPLTIQQEISAEVFKQADITYLHAPIVDQHAPDLITVERTHRFINKMKAEGRPVLVHCHAGIGRTGTMLHAYFILEGVSLDEAKAAVRAAKGSSQFFMLSPVQQQFLRELAAGH